MVRLNGQNVSHLLIQSIRTGPYGHIAALIADIEGKIINDGSQGQAVRYVVHGDVTYELLPDPENCQPDVIVTPNNPS